MSTDTAASRSISKTVILLSWLSSLSLTFLGIVSIVTPLGLGDAITGHGTQTMELAYVRDPSPVGRGTLPRDDYEQRRACGVNKANCPGTYHEWCFFSNSTGGFTQNDTADAWILLKIRQTSQKCFGRAAGSKGNTVAGPLDIQYRSFIMAADDPTSSLYPGPRYNVDRGKPRVRGRFQAYDSFVIKEQYDAVKGLVVDSKSGSICFRNHTIPANPGLGVQLTESLLWIEPETVYVDSNITLEYSVSSRYQADHLKLVDRGGFNLTKDYPFVDLNDIQNRPELAARQGSINLTLTHPFGPLRTVP
jgi:hypothetical protein